MMLLNYRDLTVCREGNVAVRRILISFPVDRVSCEVFFEEIG